MKLEGKNNFNEVTHDEARALLVKANEFVSNGSCADAMPAERAADMLPGYIEKLEYRIARKESELLDAAYSDLRCTLAVAIYGSHKNKMDEI